MTYANHWEAGVRHLRSSSANSTEVGVGTNEGESLGVRALAVVPAEWNPCTNEDSSHKTEADEVTHFFASFVKPED